jgi:hypothetical protein
MKERAFAEDFKLTSLELVESPHSLFDTAIEETILFDEILLTVPTTNTEFSISVLLRACGKKYGKFSVNSIQFVLLQSPLL